MKLLIDIGNSQTKLGVWNYGRLSNMSQSETKNFFKIISKYKTKSINEVYISSVISSVKNKKILNHIKRNFKIKPNQIKSTKTLFGVKNGYKEPSKLGDDRWCAIVGAYNLFKTPLIIVDCGTAISVDCVNGYGQHLGGYILSGFNGYSKSFSNTDRLKKIKLNEKDIKNNLAYAKTTKDALLSGYILMVTSAIEKTFAQLRSKIKKSPLLILSGAYGKQISSHLAVRAKYEPYLVLKSLGLISEKN
ncbi:MAG: type III pantothenate kinase [Pseudomonadota bacterium]|nr:type III pantothenate kinase [Pseudomonadota bacterium]